jgi:hypothetical protein
MRVVVVRVLECGYVCSPARPYSLDLLQLHPTGLVSLTGLISAVTCFNSGEYACPLALAALNSFLYIPPLARTHTCTCQSKDAVSTALQQRMASFQVLSVALKPHTLVA